MNVSWNFYANFMIFLGIFHVGVIRRSLACSLGLAEKILRGKDCWKFFGVFMFMRINFLRGCARESLPAQENLCQGGSQPSEGGFVGFPVLKHGQLPNPFSFIIEMERDLFWGFYVLRMGVGHFHPLDVRVGRGTEGDRTCVGVTPHDRVHTQSRGCRRMYT